MVQAIDPIITSGIEKLEYLGERIRHLSSLRYASENPKVLLAIYKRLDACLRERLLEFQARFGSASEFRKNAISREATLVVALVTTVLSPKNWTGI